MWPQNSTELNKILKQNLQKNKMELENLKDLWQAKQAENQNLINTATLNKLQQQRIESNFKMYFWGRCLVMVLHIIALGMLLFFMVKHINDPYYLLSALVLTGFYTYLAWHTWQQIKAVNSLKKQQNIINTQIVLANIQSQNLLFLRLSVLYIPVFLSYPVVVPRFFADINSSIFSDFDIMKASGGVWWQVQIITFLVLIPLGIWFYNQIKAENLNKPWVHRIIKKSSHPKVLQSLEYLNELKNDKQFIYQQKKLFLCQNPFQILTKMFHILVGFFVIFSFIKFYFQSPFC